MRIASQRHDSPARRSTARMFAALALAASALGGPASAQQLGTIRFDNWLYFQENINDSERWQYRPRFYIPFGLPHGWTFTQRIDLPVYYTNNTGPENPDGGWKSGIGDWFIEEAFTSPEVSKNLRLFGSVRFVFPTGGAAPFGGNQYQWAPALGAIYAIPEHRITISPTARYFMSYHAVRSGGSEVRKLDLFPTVTFGLPDNWSLALLCREPDHLQRRHQQMVRADRRDADQAAVEDSRVRLRRRLRPRQGRSAVPVHHQRPADVLLLAASVSFTADRAGRAGRTPAPHRRSRTRRSSARNRTRRHPRP